MDSTILGSLIDICQETRARYSSKLTLEKAFAFPLGDIFRANKKKANVIGGDVVSVCRQPMKLLLMNKRKNNSENVL